VPEQLVTRLKAITVFLIGVRVSYPWYRKDVSKISVIRLSAIITVVAREVICLSLLSELITFFWCVLNI
jgi:hypothetical protein